MGAYLARIWRRDPTWLDPLLEPVERAIYRLCGVDPRISQHWTAYALSLLAFNAAGFLLLFVILLAQGILPFNPQHASGLSPSLAFGAAVSFVTNTDWLPVGGERLTSELAQTAGFLTQNFLSAGSALAVAAALTRAFGANRHRAIGNFWSDLVRAVLYFLLPLSIGLSLVLALLGVPETFAARLDAPTLEGGVRQMIAAGPLAAQVAIAQLGTNGAGFFDASAAHPFVNPSPLTNLIEAAGLYAAGLACLFAFGRALHERTQARVLVAAVVLAVGAMSGVIYAAETAPSPALAAAHAADRSNMEGKEVRFGAPASAVFAAVSNGARDGTLNADLESFTPLGSGTAMFIMQLGGMLPGSIGAGLASVVLFSLVTVVVGGMVVGRTPEFLGKKIELREIRLAMLSMLVLNLSILAPSAIAVVTPAALAARSVGGPHGLMEIIYAYTSAAANTGSAFQGLDTAGAFWAITLGVTMIAGRYAVLVPAIAVAGSIAAKPKIQPTEGALPTDGPLFVVVLLCVLLLVSGLQYFPSLALGPVAEQLEVRKAVSGLSDPGRGSDGATTKVRPSNGTGRS